MKQDHIQFLDELGGQFARVESQPVAARPPRRRRLGLLRPLVIAGIGMALGAAAVAAVVGSDPDVDTTGLFGAEDRVTLAEGTTRAGSPWLLTSARGGAGTAIGARDSFCLSLRVIGDRGPEASVYCGPIIPGTFSGGLAEDGSSGSGLIFGTAPDTAATVAVLEPGSSIEFETIDDAGDIPGRFFVADAGGDYRETRLVFTDAHGRELHEPETVTDFLRRAF